MNKFYLIFIFGIFSNVIYSQSRMTGQVLSVNTPLSNVEIINSTKKNVVKSDEKGEFQIQAEPNDIIVFFLNGYIQKSLNVLREHITGRNRIILEKNIIELEEIKIVKAPKIAVINSYESLKEAKISKEMSRPKVAGVYTGEFQNGVDFVAIGSKFAKLVKKTFKKNNSKEKEVQIPFEESINTYFDNKKIIKMLKLSEDELNLFFEFCKNDVNVETILSQNNELSTLEFLMKKRKDFKPE